MKDKKVIGSSQHRCTEGTSFLTNLIAFYDKMTSMVTKQRAGEEQLHRPVCTRDQLAGKQTRREGPGIPARQVDHDPEKQHRSRDVILLPCSHLVRLHLECWVQFLAPIILCLLAESP